MPPNLNAKAGNVGNSTTAHPQTIWLESPDAHASEKADVHGAQIGVGGHGHEAEERRDDSRMIPNSSALVPASSESCWELWVPAPAKTSNQSLHFRSEASELDACQDFSLSLALSVTLPPPHSLASHRQNTKTPLPTRSA